jgi:hypothetical protein
MLDIVNRFTKNLAKIFQNPKFSTVSGSFQRLSPGFYQAGSVFDQIWVIQRQHGGGHEKFWKYNFFSPKLSGMKEDPKKQCDPKFWVTRTHSSKDIGHCLPVSPKMF